MPYLILPSRRARQPSGQAAIDWSHPLATGLVAAFIPRGCNFYDLVSGQFSSSSTGSYTNTVRVPKDGNRSPAIAIIGSVGGNTQVFANQTGVDKLTNRASFFAEFRPEINGTGPWVVRSSDQAVGNTIGMLTDDVSIQYNSFHYDAQYGVRASSGTDALGTNAEQYTHRFGLSYDGSNVRFFSFGSLFNTAAGLDAVADANRRTYLLGSSVGSGGGGSAGASASLMLAWNRAIGLAEYQALYDNPWQIFRSDRQRFYSFPPPSAGGFWMSI